MLTHIITYDHKISVLSCTCIFLFKYMADSGWYLLGHFEGGINRGLQRMPIAYCPIWMHSAAVMHSAAWMHSAAECIWVRAWPRPQKIVASGPGPGPSIFWGQGPGPGPNAFGGRMNAAAECIQASECIQAAEESE